MEFQLAKKAKLETDPKSIIPEEYYDLLHVISKKNSDTVPPHQKYDHKNISEEEQKYRHTPLYKMSLGELDVVKCYLNSHLAKGFIQVSLALYLSVVLFVKKSGRSIRFCVDYRKLNAITKKRSISYTSY